jgi:transaldolase
MVGKSLATRSVIEALAATSSDIEVWWDSSPLIYPGWIQETVAKIADPARRAEVETQLRRLHDPANPEKNVIVGVTTNPPLTLQAIQKNPSSFEPWIDEQVRRKPGISAHELFWLTYKHVVALGAAEFEGVFEVSGYRRGYLSGQVDPRILQDTDEMVRQGIELNRANRNVMVKMPGTKEGIEGVRRLAAQGIPTNATLTFVLPQLIAVAEAVKAGAAEARAKGVDASKWRAVCTMMLGRFEDAKEFRRQAEALGIELTESDLRWAGTAVMKKAYRIYKERGYETKLLAASMRPGPKEGGKARVRHVEELLGGDVVLTIFPNIFEALVFGYEPDEMTSHIDSEVPAEVLEKLLRVPYFAAAYDEHGIAPEDFLTHPAVVETGTAFAQATADLEAYCASRIAAVAGK